MNFAQFAGELMWLIILALKFLGAFIALAFILVVCIVAYIVITDLRKW